MDLKRHPPLRGLIFDKDGTLCDFTASWGDCMLRAMLDLAEGDAGLAARLCGRIGYDPEARRFDPDSVVIAGTAQEVAARLAPVLPDLSPAEILTRMNAVAEQATMVPVVPLRPFFLRLRALGLKLGVATNDAEAPARAHLAAEDALDVVDFVLGFDSGYGGKPEPGQLLAFARKTGLAPSELAMVGDSLHDLKAARAAGMRAVAVLTGVAGREELAPAAEVVLDSIADLDAWLEGQISV